MNFNRKKRAFSLRWVSRSRFSSLKMENFTIPKWPRAKLKVSYARDLVSADLEAKMNIAKTPNAFFFLLPFYRAENNCGATFPNRFGSFCDFAVAISDIEKSLKSPKWNENEKKSIAEFQCFNGEFISDFLCSYHELCATSHKLHGHAVCDRHCWMRNRWSQQKSSKQALQAIKAMAVAFWPQKLFYYHRSCFEFTICWCLKCKCKHGWREGKLVRVCVHLPPLRFTTCSIVSDEAQKFIIICSLFRLYVCLVSFCVRERVSEREAEIVEWIVNESNAQRTLLVGSRRDGNFGVWKDSRRNF